MIASDRVVELHECTLASERPYKDEAAQVALQSLDIFHAVYGQDSPDAANVSNYLSWVAESRAQFAEAEQHARCAWEIMERVGDRCNGSKATDVRIDALTRIGTSQRAGGYYDEAEIWLQRALDLAKRSGRQIVAALNNLGVVYKCSGRLDEAERLYWRALEFAEDHSSAMAATLYRNLGEIAHLWERFADGEWFGRRAWEIRRTLLGPDHPETLADACAYAALLDGLGRHENAEAICRDALVKFEDIWGGEHMDIATCLHNLAAVRWARGDAAEAEALYKRAAAMKERLLGPWHPDTALTLCNYAALLAEEWREDEARDLASRALLVFETRLNPLHPQRAAARDLWELLSI